MDLAARAGVAIFACALVAAGSPPAIQRTAFGRSAHGEEVLRTEFHNARGMRVAVIDFGATIALIAVPDRLGRSNNVVLSLPSVDAYEKSQRRWASLIGRYAGRIGDARFTLGGVTHRLQPGRNGVTLHGGSDGYDKRVWRSEPFADRGSVGVRYRIDSLAGDQGFPGRLALTVTYRLLRARNELRIEYEARTDAPTVVNFTNHGFYNLGGAGADTVAGHRLWIAADRYAETDARKIPTARLLPVRGTPLDFTKAEVIGDRLRMPSPLIAASDGIDNSLVFAGADGRLRLRAVAEDPSSGRRMEIRSTESSVQLNTGNGFDGSEVGSEGRAYGRYAGFALETQHLPDSPNQPGFPSTVLRPGEVFRSVTSYRFSAGAKR